MALTRVAKVKANNSFEFNSQGNTSGHSRAFVSLSFSHSLGFCSSIFQINCGMAQSHVYLVNGIVVNPPLSREILREGGFYFFWFDSSTQVLTQAVDQRPEVIPHGRVHGKKNSEKLARGGGVSLRDKKKRSRRRREKTEGKAVRTIANNIFTTV